MKIRFIFAAVILQITLANTLPDYIHRCQMSDPIFDDCVLESTNKAQWPILKGKLAGKMFHETGKGNITIDNISLNSTLALGFKMVDGMKYIEALSGDTKTSSEKFEFKPYNQVTGGEPMTDEQIQEYQLYFKTIGLAIRKQAQRDATKLSVSIMNVAFKAQPFNEIYLP